MNTIEIPSGDNEGNEPSNNTAVQSVAQSVLVVENEAGAKRNKKSVCLRVWIGVLVGFALLIAVGGAAITIGPETMRMKKRSMDYCDPITETPFDIDALVFSTSVTELYASTEDVRKDVEELTKNFVNNLILSEANKRSSSVNDCVFQVDPIFGSSPLANVRPVTESVAADLGATFAKDTTSDMPSGFFKGVDDFETYQQEAGAVRSDIVKSNGVYVFTAIRSRLEIWDLEGNLFERIKLKSVSKYENDIVALLMNPQGNKLILIDHVDKDYIEEADLFADTWSTRVTVFDVEGSSLTQISQSTIRGRYADSYIVGDYVHTVTTMRLDTWSHFSEHLNRYGNEYNLLTNDEYIAAATSKAEEIMPKFIDKVVDMVIEDNEILLSPLVGFPDSFSSRMTMNQVTSFDIGIIGYDDGTELDLSKSVVFRKGNNDYVYATNQWLWIADESMVWSIDKQDYVPQTTLRGFNLDGASSRFAAFGSVLGSLLSQFSIDFVENDGRDYVRIATTQMFGGWGGPQPMPAAMIDVVESPSEFDDNNSASFQTPPVPESRTKNQIIILEVPKVETKNGEINELVELGSVNVGKKDEIITAVRFFDNLSYVVTFERTDPFYVLDLSDPVLPKVLGELEIPGFSQFMHPINEDKSVLITVGQDADENGVVLGLQISLFNSTISTDPKLVDRFVLKNNNRGSSGSSSTWDERAFRYIQVGEVGRLIIPVDIYSWDAYGSNSFDGFMVFGVDLGKTENMITLETKIDHSHIPNYDCFCCSTPWLADRSMVFGGNLMTMKNQNAISTDLVTQEMRWNLTFSDEDRCKN